MASRDRFVSLLDSTQPGPTRDWLQGLVPTMDDAVSRVAHAVWGALRAASLVSDMSPSDAADALKAARRDLHLARSSGVGVAEAEERVRTMSARHRAVNDALNLAEDAEQRLGELHVRLETAVATATTVVLRSAADGAEALDREFDSVIVGLAALDEALESFRT
jgi:hypothetical protein